MRLSFFGGGTDYPEYFERKRCAVLGTTIDKYSYITLNRLSPFFEYKIKVSYSKSELAHELNEIQHPSVRETLRFLGLNDFLDIHYFADLPAKTGLGSSSSFTVGLLNAGYAFKGEFVNKERLAQEAILIERGRIGENVGIQDQVHAAHGGFNIIRADSQGIRVQPVICSQENRKTFQDSLMLFYTGITRFASEVVKEQVQKTASASLDDYLERMCQQVDEAQDILSKANGVDLLNQLGRVMHEGWELKKRLSKNVSNSTIDEWYFKALEAGAVGGKIGGAGGGGFLILVVREPDRAKVRTALKDLLEVNFSFEQHGSSIIYSL